MHGRLVSNSFPIGRSGSIGRTGSIGWQCLERVTRLSPGLALAGILLATPAAAQNADDAAALRLGLVREVALDARRTAHITGREILDPQVLEAIGKVPRHLFVPPELVPFAYLNRPLPIGYGQTVSQPFIVALMTDLARIERNDKVLEIGVGGGYHAAVIAELAGEVHGVELLEPVAVAARERLASLGYENVKISQGDGYYGWRADAPFDVIIVRLAINHVPPALLNQLRSGGRLVAPIGPPSGGPDVGQRLMLVEKDATGAIRETAVLPVLFTYLPGGDRI